MHYCTISGRKHVLCVIALAMLLEIMTRRSICDAFRLQCTNLLKLVSIAAATGLYRLLTSVTTALGNICSCQYDYRFCSYRSTWLWLSVCLSVCLIVPSKIGEFYCCPPHINKQNHLKQQHYYTAALTLVMNRQPQCGQLKISNSI